MDNLWAPWRLQYIQNVDNGHPGECIFCAKPADTRDRDNLILYRGRENFVILNLFPYNNGHLMVVPYRHICDCNLLDSSAAAEMWELVTRAKSALEKAFHPEGFNIGMNVGRAAGAGIDHHIHMHIVPRWNGDTNFMPVVGETKVISQAIGDTYDALMPLFSS